MRPESVQRSVERVWDVRKIGNNPHVRQQRSKQMPVHVCGSEQRKSVAQDAADEAQKPTGWSSGPRGLGARLRWPPVCPVHPRATCVCNTPVLTLTLQKRALSSRVCPGPGLGCVGGAPASPASRPLQPSPPVCSQLPCSQPGDNCVSLFRRCFRESSSPVKKFPMKRA